MSETVAPYVTITEADDDGAWVECDRCEGGMMDFEDGEFCDFCGGTGVVWVADDDDEDEQ